MQRYMSLLIIMLIVSRKPHKRGLLLCLYLISYGLGRFLIEGLRTDRLYIFPGLRVSQILSLICILIIPSNASSLETIISQNHHPN